MSNPPEETHNQPETSQEFSLEQRIPQAPLPSQPNKRLIFWCRLFLWVSPGPSWALLCGLVTWLGFMHSFVAFPLALIVAIGTGYCDTFLNISVPKKNGLPDQAVAIPQALLFALLQLIIAPVCLVLCYLFLFFLISVY